MQCIAPLNAVFYSLCAADATLQGLMGNPIKLFEYLPQEAGPIVGASPFGIYNFASVDWGNKTSQGEKLTLTIDIFDRTVGSYVNLNAIGDRLYQLLHEQNANLTSDQVGITLVRYMDAVRLRDKDGITLHINLRFQVIAVYLINS